MLYLVFYDLQFVGINFCKGTRKGFTVHATCTYPKTESLLFAREKLKQ